MSGLLSNQRLFPKSLNIRQWQQFSASGYSKPVSGTIFSSDNPPCCGVPLGGIGTGCLDMDGRGVFGFSSIFNPGSNHPTWKNWRMPRKLPFIEPFLGIAIGERTWVLSTEQMGEGEKVDWCTEPQMLEREGKRVEPQQVRTSHLEKVSFTQVIDYWGHFPVVDLEYQLDCPVSVGMRAWAPFIPGDLAASNIPAIMFEVHLRNLTEQTQVGRLGFSFAGPDIQEARSAEFTRQEIHGITSGVLVSSNAQVNYFLGTIEKQKVYSGVGLNQSPLDWSNLAQGLPQPDYRSEGCENYSQQGGTSLAVDFILKPGVSQVFRFILAWYAPNIKGATKSWDGQDSVADGFLRNRWIADPDEGIVHYFTHMYAARFSNALEVARWMASNHDSLLKRIVAWQEVIYSDDVLPVWLRDSLVNNLALIAEDSYWFQARSPLGGYVFPEGAFALNESPRGCPHMSCIPCDWYGNWPIVLFFPELAESNLKLFRQFQLENGEIPFAIGKIADLPDMASPEYYWQVSLNGMCYIDLVDRLWQRTGDLDVVRDFYESVKSCNTFTMNLRKGSGGPISMPEIGGMEWFEFGEWAGMASHLGGLRMAQLLMVERFAIEMGDGTYAWQCKAWLEEGSRAMEQELWAGNYYLNFWEPETGKRSDDVMAYQLDGEWTARIHGLPGVFREDRVQIVLDTVQRNNIALTPLAGAANFTRPDGSALTADSKVAHYGVYAMFTPEVLILAMTYIQMGEKEFGLELARKFWETVCLKHGHAWDTPNMISGDDGRRLFGTDYYQNMMLWMLPAAIYGEDIQGYTTQAGLIDRILKKAA